VNEIIKKTARIGIITFIFTLLISFQAIAKPVIPSGESIGIRLELSGLLVTEVEENSIANKAGLERGDYIQDYKSIDELSTIKSGGNLQVLRHNKVINIKICEFRDNFGAKVKKSITGIGTLTFYDVENNQIYAIGHKMIDIETGADIPFENGIIYKSKIAGIKRSENGKSSELRGIFNSSNKIIGNVLKNNNYGIIGSSLNPLSEGIVETSKPIKGLATILTTIKGEKIEEYQIEIEQVIKENKDRNISIKVIDENLLNQTGGIAAGMSGSPIMQNGFLVGVVTHVSVNEPQFGYGRTIE